MLGVLGGARRHEHERVVAGGGRAGVLVGRALPHERTGDPGPAGKRARRLELPESGDEREAARQAAMEVAEWPEADAPARPVELLAPLTKADLDEPVERSPEGAAEMRAGQSRP